jgi:phosphate transport system permease protein
MKGVFNLTTQNTNFSVQKMIQEKKKKKSAGGITEKIMPYILFLTAAVSVLTTIGIVLTLIFETFLFFDAVSIKEFFTAKKWYPFSETTGSFGILPLVMGTLKVTVIAAIVAVPIGLASAIYLSEYAS